MKSDALKVMALVAGALLVLALASAQAQTTREMDMIALGDQLGAVAG